MLQEQVVAVVESAPHKYQPTRLKRVRKEVSEARKLRYGQVFLSWLARYNQLPYLFYYPARQADLLELIQQLHADVICVVTMNQLLKPELFTVPPLGAINVHPSLLPQYRGPNPLFWQYYYGDLHAGVSVHQIDVGADTGDILRQASFEIPLGASLTHQMPHYQRLTNKLLTQALRDLRGGFAEPTVQPEQDGLITAPRIKAGEVGIDWQSWSLERTWHLLRGFQGGLGLLPPAGRFRHWVIGEMHAGATSRLTPGNIGSDADGQFVQHPQGKIRLDVRWQWRP